MKNKYYTREELKVFYSNDGLKGYDNDLWQINRNDRYENGKELQTQN